jgi:hypothetical protein
LKHSVSLGHVAGNTLTLDSLVVDTASGKFSASAHGGLTLFNQPIGAGTFNIELGTDENGAPLATLNTQDPGLEFDVLHVAKFQLKGSIRSDGKFSLSGSAGPFRVTFDDANGYQHFGF